MAGDICWHLVQDSIGTQAIAGKYPLGGIIEVTNRSTVEELCRIF
jgi:hypothetical protein